MRCVGKVGTRAPAAAVEPRWWEPLALAESHRFSSIWTIASATVENVTAASLNDASASHFTGTAESGRRHRSIIVGCFIADFFVRDSCFNISISISINERGQRRVEHSTTISISTSISISISTNISINSSINISISINIWGGCS